jgi:TolB-like protein/tetratricopeptide (TPR) repeat protein
MQVNVRLKDSADIEAGGCFLIVLPDLFRTCYAFGNANLNTVCRVAWGGGMAIPASLPGTKLEKNSAGSEQPVVALAAPSAALATAVPMVAYLEFSAALRDALRDFHSADLLARNALLCDGLGGLGDGAGPSELKSLLSETVNTLFDNARDQKLRRVIELTYFQPAPKQEAVADRLSLAFGTYRRHLTNARDRLAHFLWENSRIPPPLVAAGIPAVADGSDGERSPEIGETASPRLSVVVLPFLNIGGTPGGDHLADGITETLTTDLSRSSGIVVISRSTAFSYKNKAVDSRRVGRELGVRYVLEGSVQHADGRVRFNSQLVDAESGAHLWADRFDKQCNGCLELQDEVTARLSRSVQIELIAAESRRAAREPLGRLDAVGHSLRGRAAWNQHLSQEAARRARHFFEAALRLDTHSVDALLGLANTHMWEVNMYASDDRTGQIRAAEVAAKTALTLAPDSAEAHVTQGTVLFAMRAPDRALREFEFALQLDPNLAAAHGYMGLMKFFLGRAGETQGHVAEAMRLSPRDPLLFHWHFFIGVADVYLGRVVHSLANLRRSVEINPNWALSQFVLAGALGLAGLLAEAAEVRAVAERLAPNFTIAKFRGEVVSDNPVYLAQREHMYNGLRLAGVPEGKEQT